MSNAIPAAPSAASDNPVRAARRLGQSIWLDDLHRELLDSGRLAGMVEHDGLGGVTSNPAIFEKAFAHGGLYDAAIARLAREGHGAAAICERLMVADVRDAADVLRPAHAASGGADGFVSLEVSPALAHDAGGTCREARRLVAEVARPNLMIKVPATQAGLSAIEQLLSEGISVNTTLIFAVATYQKVAQAYLSGLERFVAQGGQARTLAGVASFFVSRIDTAVDTALEQAAAQLPAGSKLRELQGKAAIANARIAYEHYQGLIAGERWRRLAAAGARPQRLLWASTGTKNPAYSKTLYVDELIGPDTVNTMPEATYREYLQHGRPRASLTEGVAAAHTVMQRLADAGISMTAVTDQLLADGVRLFAEAYDRLEAAVAQKLKR